MHCYLKRRCATIIENILKILEIALLLFFILFVFLYPVKSDAAFETAQQNHFICPSLASLHISSFIAIRSVFAIINLLTWKEKKRSNTRSNDLIC